MKTFSAKQNSFLRDVLRRRGKIYLLCGVTGSGKTYVANLSFYLMSFFCPKGYTMMVSGSTLASVMRNVGIRLMEIDHNQYLREMQNGGARYWVNEHSGAKIFFYGSSRQNSHRALRGDNVFLWYADEVTKCHRDFYNEAFARLRYEEAGSLQRGMAILTCNPENLDHYVKRELIDEAPRRPELLVYEFGFEDNPVMTDEIQGDLQKSLFGAMRTQMVEGRWSDDVSQAIFDRETASYGDFSPGVEDVVVGHVDASYGGRDTTALSVCYERAGHYHVVGKVFKRSAVESIEELAGFFSHWGASVIFIENNGDKGYLAHRLREHRRKEGESFHVREYHESENKGTKITRLVGGFWRQLIFDKEMSRGAYLEQIFSYTGMGRCLDDAPDSLACILRCLSREKKRKTVEDFFR